MTDSETKILFTNKKIVIFLYSLKARFKKETFKVLKLFYKIFYL